MYISDVNGVSRVVCIIYIPKTVSVDVTSHIDRFDFFFTLPVQSKFISVVQDQYCCLQT